MHLFFPPYMLHPTPEWYSERNTERKASMMYTLRARKTVQNQKKLQS
jgi:hypothetical protein